MILFSLFNMALFLLLDVALFLLLDVSLFSCMVFVLIILQPMPLLIY